MSNMQRENEKKSRITGQKSADAGGEEDRLRGNEREGVGEVGARERLSHEQKIKNKE
jgi:hypothetical protein